MICRHRWETRHGASAIEHSADAKCLLEAEAWQLEADLEDFRRNVESCVCSLWHFAGRLVIMLGFRSRVLLAPDLVALVLLDRLRPGARARRTMTVRSRHRRR